ncbi:MAG: response regulator, partial [Desulfobacula sp.]|uniref:response regulator n=1 Tax=Desulfobacula sp. TaxID=2593537 RepID=UPI0025C37D0B
MMMRDENTEILEILLIEDNEDDAELIEKSLDPERYHITNVWNGKKALDFLIKQENHIDVVLLDKSLPYKNGLEILKETREKGKEYAFIFLTIDNTIETAIEAMKLGALDFLPKKSGFKGLPEMIEKVFEIHQSKLERGKKEEKAKDHIKNLELLSKTAMQFVEFPQDKDIYTFTGEQLQEFTGKDSYIIINSINNETNILTTRSIIGMGKLSEKVASLLGKHPVGMTYDAKNEALDYLSDGKLHLYKEGLYGISLKIIPKMVFNSIEKLLNIKTIFTIGFSKNNELSGTVVIALKEYTGELQNKRIIEIFIKQASIAIQKRQTEKALIESNKIFKQVVSNIAIVVWKADIAKDGTFENTYSSPFVDELLALPVGTIQNDWDKYFSYIKPEYLGQVNNAFREAIISPGSLIDCEYEMLKGNGQTAWVYSKGRCFEKNGKLHIFGSTTDITRQKQAETALRKSEKNLTQAVHGISIPTVIIDNNHTITHWNNACESLTGFLEAEMVGTKKHWLAFYDEERPILADFIVDEATEEEIEEYYGEKYYKSILIQGAYEGENFFPALGEKGRWLFYTSAPLRDQDKNVIGAIETFQDLTERKNAETQFRQAQKMESVGRLAGGVAHDFNNALSVIIGFAEMALDDADPEGQLHEDLGEILTAAKRAADITRQLLAFARKQTIAPRVLDLNDNVESMLKMLRRLIGEDIDLAWLPGSSLWTVKMDPSQIDQILANLCVNARDAIEGVGKI